MSTKLKKDAPSKKTPAPRPFRFQISRRRRSSTAIPVGCDCGGCSCFPAGTLVLLANGEQKPIERIKRGDQVWGLTGINTVTSVDHHLLGSRKMLQMSDGSLRWSEEHALWMSRNGRQWWGSHNVKVLADEADLGTIDGLTRSPAPHQLQRQGESYAHVEGWKQLDAVEIPATPGTILYDVRTDGCHTAIMDGFVVSTGLSDRDFDYAGITWHGLESLRNALGMAKAVQHPLRARSLFF